MNNYYNPMQSRVDSLMQQKAMIEQQLQSLQQMNVPNININNIPSNPTPSNFDFNGKWVDGEEQASNDEVIENLHNDIMSLMIENRQLSKKIIEQNEEIIKLLKEGKL